MLLYVSEDRMDDLYLVTKDWSLTDNTLLLKRKQALGKNKITNF